MIVFDDPLQPLNLCHAGALMSPGASDLGCEAPSRRPDRPTAMWLAYTPPSH